MLRLTTFGGLALSRDGVALTGAAAQRSRLSLLALLATAGPTGFSRDKLLLHLWPESDEERARHALKQAVYSLRRELGSDEVIVGTASLSLNPVIITSDAREFETAIASGDLATAVALYTGPFLDGFHLKDSTEFERWSAEQRTCFADMWRTAVEKLAADLSARGEWRDAAGYYRKLVTAEPLSGPHTAELMRALAESGDVGAALQQFKIHETLLRQELDAAPEPAVAKLADQLKSGTWVREPRVAGSGLRVAGMGSQVATSSSTQSAPSDLHATGDPQPATRNPLPATRDSRPVSIGTARKRRKRSTALAFVLGMLLMTAAGLTITYVSLDEQDRATLSLVRSRAKPKLAPRQIVVAPFENKTGDSSLTAFGDLVADWFARELNEADFKVVDARTARIGTRVVEGIPKPFRANDENVALGEETGSAFTIYGSYHREGDSLQANVHVIDVATKHTLKTLGPFRGSVKDSTYILRMLTPTVAYLGAEVDTSAGGLIVRYSSLPPSLEAHGRVTAAWQHFFETPRDTVGVFAELDTAARLDSTYVVPLLMKAYMLDVKSQWPGVSSIVQRVRPLAPRMSRLEKAVLELFEADLRGDGLDRVEIARRLQALSPGSAEMPLLRVVSAMYIGHVQEALAAINETDPTRGMNLVTPTLLEWSAMTYHHSGSESLEERAVREELKRFKHHPPATYGLARIYAASDDSDLDELLEKGMPPARDANDPRDPVADRIELKAFAARELRSHGYATRARTIFQQLIKDEWQTPPATVVEMKRRARVLYDAGDYTAARTAYEEVMQRDSTDLEALGRIATSALRLGDTVTARRIDERLARVQRPFLMGGNHRWRAAIAAAQGRTAEAVAHLETATRQGLRLMDSPPNLTIHLDPDFVGIEKTAAFKAMLKSLAEASAVK